MSLYAGSKNGVDQPTLPGLIATIEPDAVPKPDAIVCGDSESVMQEIPDETVHLVVTSPPYWNLVDYGFANQIGQLSYHEYLSDLLRVWKQCERVLVPNGKLCINVPIVPVPKSVTPDAHTREIKNLSNDIEATILKASDLKRYSLYIWQKQTTVKMFGSYPYPPNIYENNTVEFINVYVKPGRPRKLSPAVKEANRLTQNEWIDLTRQIWWIYPEDIQRSGGHPAPFPVLLPARLIKMYTFSRVPEDDFEGDVVLDPFCGSGTTCVAAKVLGRRYIGIDGSLQYSRFAQQRLSGTLVDTLYDVRLRRLSDGDREFEADSVQQELVFME